MVQMDSLSRMTWILLGLASQTRVVHVAPSIHLLRQARECRLARYHRGDTRIVHALLEDEQ
jgi:hypothetical protein